MKILIIDDDGDKRKLLAEYVARTLLGVECEQRESFQSGCNAAFKQRPDVLLLDMTLPTYDVKPTEGETGGRQRPYGGRDVLRELQRKRIPSQAIIVTQYEMFSEGDDVMSLSGLKEHLKLTFPENYVGTVSFQSSSSSWQNELSEALSLARERLARE